MAMRARKHAFDQIKRGSIHLANVGIHFSNWLTRKTTRPGEIPNVLGEIELPERAPIKIKYGGFVAGFGRDIALAAAMSSLALITTGSQIKLDNIQPRIEEIASQSFQEYLLTGTSKMVPNFASINDALALQLERVTSIERGVDQGVQNLPAQSENSKTYLIISDTHNLPTAAQLTESIARAGNVDGIIILGDFLNTGIQAEIDALGTFNFEGTEFRGFDDIKTCVEYIDGKCTKEGKQFEIYALLGNHDTRTLRTKLEELGIKSLVSDPPEFLRNEIALDDECFVEEDTCQGGIYKDVNARASREFRDSIDFSEANINRPSIGFFASDTASEEFEGVLDTVVFGGKHKFTFDDNNGSTQLGVGAIGAGLPREADYSNAVIAEFSKTPNGLTMSNCVQAQWDVFDPGKGIEATTCGR